MALTLLNTCNCVWLAGHWLLMVCMQMQISELELTITAFKILGEVNGSCCIVKVSA